VDLFAALTCQMYVERLFSICGDLKAWKRKKTKGSLEDRVVMKLHCVILAKSPKSAVYSCQ